MNLSILEAKELSNQKVIDFNGDYIYAVKFYNHLQDCMVNSARLIIDIDYDSRGAVGSYIYTEEYLQEEKKYNDELNN